MMPLIFAILVGLAIAVLALALWLDSVALGAASAIFFFITGAMLLNGGVVGLPGFVASGIGVSFLVLGIGAVFFNVVEG